MLLSFSFCIAPFKIYSHIYDGARILFYMVFSERIFRLGTAFSTFSGFPQWRVPDLRHRAREGLFVLHGDGLVQEFHLLPRFGRTILTQKPWNFNLIIAHKSTPSILPIFLCNFAYLFCVICKILYISHNKALTYRISNSIIKLRKNFSPTLYLKGRYIWNLEPSLQKDPIR